MACNCGKTKATSWDYIGKDGQAKTYPSEIQARAAVVRNGGGKVVARVSA